MQNNVQNQRNAVLLLALMIAAGVAHADATLPPEVTAAMGEIKGNWDLLKPLIWTTLASVTGGFILMKLFKKGANKSV
jgi:hypothetical protein